MFSNFIFEQVGGLGTKKHHYNCPYAITRAFGHINENHPYGLKDPKTGAIFKVDDLITATPEIRTQKLTEDDEFILMACDGIWDELSSQDAVTLVRDYLIKNPGDFKGAGALLREAVIKKRPGKDNNLDDITVIIVDLKKMKESGSHAPAS